MDRYEKALAKARAGKSLEEIFPELKESEDEGIRKAIVHLLKVASESYLIDATGFKKEQFLSYLEKQKEQKGANGNEKEIPNGQKPAEWSEKDELMRETCIYLLEHDEVIGPWKNCIAWLKSLPERFNLQPKQEWTIEDAKPGDILHTSSTASSKTFIFKGIRNDEHGSVECFCCYDSEDGFRKGEEELIGWKTDKYRLATPKQCIKLGRIMGKAGYIFHFETNKLQKLNKLYWKPSEEQMGALNYAYCKLFKREDVEHNILGPLQKLIDQLKKL